MQHLQAISQKFIIEGQNPVELFIFHPPTPNVYHLGNLYVLGEVETFGYKDNSRIILLNSLASIIKKTYYSFSDQNSIVNAIELTLKKTKIYFKNSLKNFKGSLHLLVIIISGNKIYFSKAGKADIWLIRDAKWTLVSHIKEHSFKSQHGVLFTQLFSGKILPDDIFIAVTPKIVPYMLLESFRIKLTSLPFEQTLSFLKKNIKEVDPASSAAILRIDIKEAPYTSELIKQELPLKETVKNHEISKADLQKSEYLQKNILRRVYPLLEKRADLLKDKKNKIFKATLVVFLILILLLFTLQNQKSVKNTNLTSNNLQTDVDTNRNYQNLAAVLRLQKLADFSQTGFSIKPHGIYNFSDNIILIDSKTVTTFNFKDRSLKTSFINLPLDQNFFSVQFPFTNFIYIIPSINPTKILLYDIASQTAKTFKVNLPSENIIVKDMAIYGSSLYILTNSNDLIYKIPVLTDFSLGTPEKWIKDKSFKISVTPLSLAIDSFLYVLDADGKISKFFKGRKTAEFDNKTDAPIDSLNAKIFTSPSFKNLYITDPINGRIIILSKDGTNFSQIVNNNLKDTRLISISSDEKMIFAINPSGLFEINL